MQDTDPVTESDQDEAFARAVREGVEAADAGRTVRLRGCAALAAFVGNAGRIAATQIPIAFSITRKSRSLMATAGI